MSTQELLVDELQNLEKQKADAMAHLHQIEGAIAVCRHLLAKDARKSSVSEGELNAGAALNGKA